MEAENCGKALKDVKFDAVYSSDLKRARQTCDIILKVRIIDPIFKYDISLACIQLLFYLVTTDKSSRL